MTHRLTREQARALAFLRDDDGLAAFRRDGEIRRKGIHRNTINALARHGLIVRSELYGFVGWEPTVEGDDALRKWRKQAERFAKEAS